jgi:putative component of membrane protein insertase Oxa1/YidC/SpoIIIJ protein YidD
MLKFNGLAVDRNLNEKVSNILILKNYQHFFQPLQNSSCTHLAVEKCQKTSNQKVKMRAN